MNPYLFSIQEVLILSHVTVLNCNINMIKDVVAVRLVEARLK